MRNTLGQDLVLLADGQYGKITNHNDDQVTERLSALILFHNGQHRHLLVCDAWALRQASNAVKRDLPEVAERMNLDILMNGLDATTPRALVRTYRHSFLTSLINNIEIELACLSPDKDFFRFLR